MTTDADSILFEVRGIAGVITLNRPKALNALTLDMAVAMLDRLADWADDPAIDRVVIKATGERAFCAGGDIRTLYEWGRAGDPRAQQFYRYEYALNAAIKAFPKPYIALIDGIVMGGGVGLSIHGSHRVGTEAVTFAMPETGIGLFPDVGATHFLPRMAGRTGHYLGLTGARLQTADALYAGALTHCVPRASHDALLAALCAPGAVDDILAGFAEPAGASGLAAIQPLIDRCFAGESVEAICALLVADGGDWAQTCLARLAEKSPTSLKITHRQLTLGGDLDFQAAMRLELRIVMRVLKRGEFFEGVRALIIDKDNAPNWQPDSLDKIADSDIDVYFEPLTSELDI